jgi:signal transduction histidine kinase
MESQTQLTIFIIVTFIAMIAPTALIIGSSSLYKRRLLEKEAKIREIKHEQEITGFKMVLEAQENEREKIAKNLHDGIIPNFCAIQSNLETNAALVQNETYLAKLNRDITALSKAITEVRVITHDLAPPTLLKLGLIAALDEHIDYLTTGRPIETNFEDRTNFKNGLPFNVTEQNNIYRICLELLQNLIKYANFKGLQVFVENNLSHLKIELIHDGKGITTQEIETLTTSTKGIGLKSLQSRAIILNATIDYSFDEHTAGIVVTIPLKQH